jgi:hypothetical protein
MKTDVAPSVRMTGKQPNGKTMEANGHVLTVAYCFDDVTLITAFV